MDWFISDENGVTFSKRVLEDLGYPQTVQYSTDPAHHIFAIRVCKSNESKATAFSKTKGEQAGTLSCGNRTLHDTLTALIPNHVPKTRYRIVGEYNAENKLMLFDCSTAEVSQFRKE